jgi:pimeloyl-ACP methyl ester carboxylesterase
MRSSLPTFVVFGALISGCGSSDKYSYDEPDEIVFEDDEDSSDNDSSDDDSSDDDGTPVESEDDTEDDVEDDTEDEDEEDTEDEEEDTEEPVRSPGEAGDLVYSVLTPSEINGEIYMPAGDGPYPIVLFSPGFQLNPLDYRTYAEHYASWGYITVLVDFEDSLFGGPTHTDHYIALGAMLDWLVSDASVLGDSADKDSIALMGHSMGGKISLLLGSYDSRIDALIGIDPVDATPPFGGSAADYPSVTPEMMPYISAPMLLIGEKNNATGSFACAPEGQNFQDYYESATSPTLEVDFTTASHMSFVDNPFCLVCIACPEGTDDPAVTREYTRAVTTAFLEAELHGAAWASTWLRTGGLTEIAATGLVSTRSKNGF